MKLGVHKRPPGVAPVPSWSPFEEDDDAQERATGLRALGRRVGIALGVLVFALVVLGEGIFLAESVRGGAVAGSQPPLPVSGSLPHRLQVILARALGPSDRGVRRFRITRITALPRGQGKEVDIDWAINNDLAGGTVGNGAQAEVYTMLRDLYSSGLALGLVRLVGTYPLHAGARDSVVMRLSMDKKTAALVGQMGWDNVDPPTFWPLVNRAYVNPNLQPLPPE